MMDPRNILCFLATIACFSAISGELYNVVNSEDFDQIKSSREIVVISFTRSKPQSDAFQENFKEAGDYLQEFGVHFGTVDCSTDPVTEYCNKPDIATDVFVFRYGSFFLTLAYDTLFGVDSIVSNILHLVLIVDVPITSHEADLTASLDRHRGKRDVILGYVPAVGTSADRAFMEVAFAYRHRHPFLVTTNRGLMAGAEEQKQAVSQFPEAEVAILRCSKAGPKETCPWSKYHGPITTESLALMLKILDLPDVVDITGPGQSNPFHEHWISAVYAVTDPTHHKEALSVVMETKDEFYGSIGFVVVNENDVSDPDLLPSSAMCIPACFAIRGQNEVIPLGEVKDAVTLSNLIQANIPHAFSHLDNPALHDNQDETYEHGEEEEDELPVQERQDDRVQEATVHLRLSLTPRDSIVPELTDKTFPKFIGQSQLTAVLFTMKWNPRCLAFLESFEAAAQSIIRLSSEEMEDSPLAQVECSSWPDVCDKSNVTVYPTVKMYRGGSEVGTYRGVLDKDNLLRSYLLFDLPNPVVISSPEDKDSFIAGTFPASWVKGHLTSVTLAVIPKEFSTEKSVFEQVAKELWGTYMLGLCSSDCANQERQSKNDPSVTIYKWNDPHGPQARFKGEFTPEKLQSFIKRASLPILPELTAATMPRYLARQKPFVILFHAGDPISDKAATSLRAVATDKNYNQFIPCQMDTSKEDSVGSHALTSYGFLPVSDQSTVVILDHAAGEVCRYPHGRDSSQASLKAWLRASLNTPKECSEARALLDHEWKPLVPPYDYLRFMADAEHSVGHGRRGLRPHHEDDTAPMEEGGGGMSRDGKMPPGGEGASRAPMDAQKHSHQHVEL